MIHVATVHAGTTKWIDIQRLYLEHHIDEPFKVWGGVQGIPEEHWSRFDVAIPCVRHHRDKLNLLAHAILTEADDDDIIVFLDSDAFPITEIMPAIRRELEGSVLVAVQRRENFGDIQPHPLFCAVTAGRWRELNGDWCCAHTWRNSIGETLTDTGGNLLYILASRGLLWTPVLRSNTVNLHPVLFGLYGGLVYHHGAGSRQPFTRADEFEYGLGWSQAGTAVRRKLENVRIRRARRMRTQKTWETGERLFAELRRDREFFRALGEPHVGLGPPITSELQHLVAHDYPGVQT